AVRAKAWRAPSGEPDLESFLAGASNGSRDRITIDDLDVLLLRSDPADDLPERPWAQTAGLLFGQRAAERGVVVLNDPVGLSRALTKLYLQSFPADVRPATLVTRDPGAVRDFVEHRGGHAVLKPLQGSKGHGVFLVHPDDEVNLDQMIEALTRDGYLIAQEYVPAAAEGDLRLFLLEGRPLQLDGAYAAFRRVPAPGEARANMRAGATAEAAMIDDRVRRLAARIGPRLADDGMFLVGLDIAGDQLLEVNVFSPGGLGSARRTTGVDFAPGVVAAIERKAHAREARQGRTGD
ncbi:MAG: glutathione synthase, partial [Actinomycetota bacterium]